MSIPTAFFFSFFYFQTFIFYSKEIYIYFFLIFLTVGLVVYIYISLLAI